MPVLRTDCVNPGDTSSGLRLMSNGFILPYGNAIAPTDWQIPSAWVDASARDMVVIDFLTPSGYIMSGRGIVYPFGGVTPAIGFQDTGSLQIWRKLIMNPFGNGQGYQVDCRGRWFRFGPTLPPTIGGDLSLVGDVNRAGGHDWGADVLVDATMDWATKRWAMLDWYGHVVSNPFTVTMDSPVRPLATDAMYRALCFTNPNFPSGDTAGYVVRRDGAIFGFDGAETTPAMAIGPFPNLDVVRDATVISDGRAGRPLIIQEALTTAGLKQVLASSAPTVVVNVTPFSSGTTVTATSRPTATVDYTDPNGDALAALTFRWFSSAQYSVGGFDPTTSPYTESTTYTDGSTFTDTVATNLANGSWRAYARATDASGNVSAWAFKAFTMGVTAPTTPTVTAVPDPSNWWTTVTATAGGGTASGALAAIEYSDDAGTTWEPVVGANPPTAYPTSGSKIVTVHDFQAPFNTSRMYRARTLSPDGFVTSASSSTTTATLQSDQWVLGVAATGVQAAVEVVPPFEYSQPTGGTALDPIGRGTAVVVQTGQRAKKLNLSLRAWDRAEFDALSAIIASRQALHLRDPYRRSLFFAVVDDRQTSMLEVLSNPFESTTYGFAHVVTVAVAEVDRP